MSEEINKIFEQWKQFLSWCYENNDKTTEIHRDNLEKVMAYTRQLENKKKEAREYIDKHAKWDYSGGTLEEHSAEWYDLDITVSMLIRELLEILDKENK